MRQGILILGGLVIDWWYGPYKSPHTSLEKWIISTTYSRILLSLGGYLDVMLLAEFDMTYVIGNAFNG